MLLTLTALGTLGPACRPAPAPDDSGLQMPERQFILEKLRIEERRGEKLLWSGTAERADGDLSSTAVENIRLVRPDPSRGDEPLTITAPRGRLDLDAGTARFEEVRVVDANGGVLTASSAFYDGKAARLTVDGPLDFHAQGLVAHATSALVHLDSGAMEIAGPIVGRFVKAPANRP